MLCGPVDIYYVVQLPAELEYLWLHGIIKRTTAPLYNVICWNIHDHVTVLTNAILWQTTCVVLCISYSFFKYIKRNFNVLGSLMCKIPLSKRITHSNATVKICVLYHSNSYIIKRPTHVNHLVSYQGWTFWIVTRIHSLY